MDLKTLGELQYRAEILKAPRINIILAIDDASRRSWQLILDDLSEKQRFAATIGEVLEPEDLRRMDLCRKHLAEIDAQRSLMKPEPEVTSAPSAPTRGNGEIDRVELDASARKKHPEWFERGSFARWCRENDFSYKAYRRWLSSYIRRGPGTLQYGDESPAALKIVDALLK